MTATARGVTLPSGRVFDLSRPRSDGVLDREEHEYCVRCHIPIGYDPAQLGWVTLLGEDDLADGYASMFGSASADQHQASDLSVRILQLRERFSSFARPLVEQVKAGVLPPVAAEGRLRAGVDLVLERVRFVTDLITFEKGYTTLRCLAAQAIGQFRGPGLVEPDGAARARLTFRPWQLADAALYRRLLDNPKLWAFVPEEYPSPFTEETARVLIEASQVTSHHEVLAAELDGTPVGQVRLLFDESYPTLQAAEVSYWIGEEHWGKGLGATALQIFTHRSFRRRPLDLIYAWIRTAHAASIKTAERAGYRRDPFPQLPAFASQVRRAECDRWICFRSDCVAAAGSPSPPRPHDTALRRRAASG